MIALEPLTEAHMERFPVSEFELDYWRGLAVAAVEDGQVLGLCGISVDGDTAYVGMILSPAIRQHAAFLHRTTLLGIRGLRLMGVKQIRAKAETEIDARWLERLGFIRDGGWYIQ